MLLPWSEIETVLLDMDGTLLDLHFDNYFWLDYLPQCYSQAHNVSYEKAKELITQECMKVEGRLEWYCVDYWTQLLDLPIMRLKETIADRIQWRCNAQLFLQRINEMGKEVVLITNAHPASLSLKDSRVNLVPWFSQIITSHDYGYPKENYNFWVSLQHAINFNPDKTLFIDDSLTVLDSAKAYKIKYICTVLTPDSKKEPREDYHGYGVIEDYAYCF